MILSGKTLAERPPLKPFEPRSTHDSSMTFGCGPASYDIRSRDSFHIAPGGFHCFDALEEFEMQNDICAIVHDKSTWARVGLAMQNTLIDPGFKGVLRLEASNHGTEILVIEKGMPIAQVVFHLLDRPAEPYNGRYQGQGAGQDAILKDRRIFSPGMPTSGR